MRAARLRVLLPLALFALLPAIAVGARCTKKSHAIDADPIVKATFAPMPPRYPRPPMQGATWTPPETKLAPDVVAAMQRVFDDGMADPRACTYRAVDVVVGELWSGGGAHVVKTHAWVYPQRSTSDFAIAPSGLVYRVERVYGEPVSAAADVDAILADIENAGFDVATEPVAVSHKTPQPTFAALLLRAGEGALAARVWSATTHRAGAPYDEIASAWTWAAFERAVMAHMRGDDALAYESAEPLVSFRRQPQAAGSTFDFLGAADALVADSERRLRAPVSRVDPNAIGGTREEKVRALVAALDQVDARQWGQPGWVSMDDDPIVRALVAMGEDAVEPLLAVVESDTRLTRSVHFWRDFARSRSLLGVHEAAMAALTQILGTQLFTPEATGDDLSAHGLEGRRAIVAKVRAARGSHARR